MNVFDFSQPLKTLIDREQITQRQVAEAAGRSESTVTRWVNADGPGPDVSDLIRMRDSKRLPAWFRSVCAQVTADGRLPDPDEHEQLDADHDGRITQTDIRLLGARKQVAAAKAHSALEAALIDGRITREELAEIERDQLDEEINACRVRRATELVAR